MRYIVGIDEVGRGPLAGPITVGVVCIPSRMTWSHFPQLKDSKQLSELARERWFTFIKKHSDIRAAVASVPATTIDRIGIVAAGNLAARRALAQLQLNPKHCDVQLDKGLGVGADWKQKSYIKGDERFPAIALASIYAKVTRDRYMTRVSREYPEYAFDIHKGYGTKKHCAAIRTHGVSLLHRRSFLKKFRV